MKKEIKNALKEDRILFGLRQAIKAQNSNKAEKIIVVDVPHLKENLKNPIIFDGDSRELGIICGKPFNISVLTIFKNKTV